MRVLLGLAIVALAGALTLLAAGPAEATCGWRCQGMVPAPPPAAPPVSPAPHPAAPEVYPYYGFAPVYLGGCASGFGNCYWRRDCWYDAFGRRFCSW